MHFNHILAGFAGAAALFGTAIAWADNPEHDATSDRQAYDSSHATVTDRTSSADRNGTNGNGARAADRGSLQVHPFIRGFRVLTPEEEMQLLDPSGNDPRIGRYQNPNAPN